MQEQGPGLQAREEGLGSSPGTTASPPGLWVFNPPVQPWAWPPPLPSQRQRYLCARSPAAQLSSQITQQPQCCSPTLSSSPHIPSPPTLLLLPLLGPAAPCPMQCPPRLSRACGTPPLAPLHLPLPPPPPPGIPAKPPTVVATDTFLRLLPYPRPRRKNGAIYLDASSGLLPSPWLPPQQTLGG